MLGLRGVGPESARKLAEINIRTPRDLAATYPRDYKDWRRPASVGDVVRRALGRAQDPQAPESAEEILIGRVVRTSEFRGRIPIVSAELEDESGTIWRIAPAK